MTWLQLLILALIQGLTEFLPISSSAHLILPAQIWGWEDQGVLMDVMAHVGTLFAVLIYFRADVRRMFAGFFDLLARRGGQNASLALNLIVATPPGLFVGAFIGLGGYDAVLRSPLLIAGATIFFGVLLWLSDIWGRQDKTVEDLTWRGALLIGCAQMLAFIPGTSRSGITMTAARGLGYTRVEAARFSMLMSLPIIGAGGLFALMKLMGEGAGSGNFSQALVMAGVSFVVAYLTIAVFMKYVPRIGMFPFMISRLILGVGLLIYFV